MFEVSFHLLKSFLVLTLFTIFLIICLPFFLYRWLILILVPLFYHSEISHIVSAQDHTFLSTDLSSNIITTFRIAGSCDLENLKANINDRFVHAQNDNNNGTLLYPELQQFPTRLFGYYFWKWESNFNIDKHVLYHNEPKMNQDSSKKLSKAEVDIIETKFLESKFETNKSPWEFLIIDNEQLDKGECQKPYFLLILKFHHSLADINSMLAATLKLDEVEKMEEDHHFVSPQSRKILKVKKNLNKYNNILSLFLFPILASYDLVKILKLRSDIKQLPRSGSANSETPHQQTTLSKSTNNKSRPNQALSSSVVAVKDYAVKTNLMQISAIKRLAHANKVQFSSIIIAGLTGGLRNYLLLANRCLQSEIPQYLLCITPIIINNTTRVDKLGNDLCLVTLPLPIGIQDAHQRLQICNQIIIEKTASTEPYLTNLLLKLIGLLPLNNCHLAIEGFSVGCSCFVGSLLPFKIAGQIVLGANYRAVSSDDISVALTSYSYGSNLEWILTCNTNLCSSQDEATQLSKCIEDEYFNMEKIFSPK